MFAGWARDGDGLIPARAGKTATTNQPRGCRRAHPRAGGENRQRQRDNSDQAGSSPRGRGKPEGFDDVLEGEGLIPARAGKTSERSRDRRATGAHPRAGGENIPGERGVVLEGGSSPRGRGKLIGEPVDKLLAGLIPARAGKTNKFCRWLRDAGAHPRAGGENHEAATSIDPAHGSSPRGRGKPIVWSRLREIFGLIPARAGKTLVRVIL